MEQLTRSPEMSTLRSCCHSDHLFTCIRKSLLLMGTPVLSVENVDRDLTSATFSVLNCQPRKHLARLNSPPRCGFRLGPELLARFVFLGTVLRESHATCLTELCSL